MKHPAQADQVSDVRWYWCSAFCLVAFQVGGLAWLGLASRTVLLALLLLLMAGALQVLSRGLSNRTHLVLVVVCGLMYGVLGFNAALHGQTIKVLCQILAQCLLIVQCLELIRVPRDRQHNYFPGLSAITIMLVILSLESEEFPSNLELLLVSLLALQFLVLRSDLPRLLASGRVFRRKAWTLLFITFASLLAGRLFQQELQRDLPQLRRYMGMLSSSRDSGPVVASGNASFVRRVGLNSIADLKRVSPDQLVFNADSQRPPGYMRTLSFSTFDGFSWSIRPAIFQVNRRSFPILAEVASREFGNMQNSRIRKLFPLQRITEFKGEGIFITVPSGTGSLVPLPIEATGIVAESSETGQITLDEHGNVVPGSLNNRAYTVFQGTRQEERLDAEYRKWLLRLPADDADFLSEFARSIVEPDSNGTLSVEAAVAAIGGYFQSRFQYSLDKTAVTDARTPMRRFLEDQHPAHCEYFATATVLLMRGLGLPARLSTGYLVYEYNDEADVFQATNAAAHAWAEVFDDQTGRWIVVESTPGIPQYIARMEADPRFGGDADALARRSNAGDRQQAGLLWNLLVELLSEIRHWVTLLLANRFAWVLPLASGGLYFVWLAVRSRWTGRASGMQPAMTPEARKADRLARRCGFNRAPHETCEQFARRLGQSEDVALHSLARWYEDFGRVRYADETVDVTHTSRQREMRQRLARLPSRLGRARQQRTEPGQPSGQ